MHKKTFQTNEDFTKMWVEAENCFYHMDFLKKSGYNQKQVITEREIKNE